MKKETKASTSLKCRNSFNFLKLKLLLWIVLIFGFQSNIKANHIYGGRFEYELIPSVGDNFNYRITYRIYTTEAFSVSQLAVTTTPGTQQYVPSNLPIEIINQSLSCNYLINTVNLIRNIPFEEPLNSNTCIESFQYSYSAIISFSSTITYAIRLQRSFSSINSNYYLNCCPVTLTNIDPDIQINGTSSFRGFASNSTLIFKPSDFNKRSVNLNNVTDAFSHHYTTTLNTPTTLQIPYIQLPDNGNDLYQNELILANPIVLNPLQIITSTGCLNNAGVNTPENLFFQYNNGYSFSNPINTTSGFNLNSINNLSLINFEPTELGQFLVSTWLITRKAPNPNNGTFTLSFGDEIEKSIFIYNLQGLKVFETKTSANELFINDKSLAKGIYIVHVNSEIAHKQFKLVINE